MTTYNALDRICGLQLAATHGHPLKQGSFNLAAKKVTLSVVAYAPFSPL